MTLAHDPLSSNPQAPFTMPSVAPGPARPEPALSQEATRSGESSIEGVVEELALSDLEGRSSGDAEVGGPPIYRLFLDLADAAGAGLVRVDLAGLAIALNPTGTLLLEALGGADGEAAPAPILDALAAAALDGFPALRDAAAQTPEARRISVTALVRDDEQLVSLRDHTEERLLQERLLQSEKMASVGQLVSGVAHELNNPLTAVTGFAQVLLARPELDATARAQLQMVYEEGERAAKIVQNLLSFARRRRPAKETTDLNVLVERVLELRSYDFGMRNISLDMTLDWRMARVWVDPDQIQQVLFNLVKNAEQAMTDANGGGKLTVRSLPSPAGRGVRVSIADDGPGVAPEVQRRIFDPFFTTKEAGQGTGLGLTISYSIIAEHNGRIWAENAPTGGAVFTIELPMGEEPGTGNKEQERPGASSVGEARPSEDVPGLALHEDPTDTSGQALFRRPEPIEGPEPVLSSEATHPGESQIEPAPEGGPGTPSLSESAASAEPARARPRPLRILVVDDEESIRLLLSDVLTMDGHQADLAATGIEAMEKLAKAAYDVIISDIKMPGMDGATLYRELVRLDTAVHPEPARSQVEGALEGSAQDRKPLAQRLIFITGDTVSPDTRAFLSSTPAPVLTKPFRVATLREAIEGVVAATSA